jgi:microcystin-dependent protein
MEPFFIAQICIFGGNFAPRGWAFCQGQLLSISQFTALFSLLGTTYGGNGQTTFALPDLRGRIPVGPGLSSFQLGEMGGVFNSTLTVNQIPQHTHFGSANVNVKSAPGNTVNPANAIISGGIANSYASAANATGTLSGTTATVQPTGSTQPFTNVMPSMGINFIIALEGIYPSRN